MIRTRVQLETGLTAVLRKAEVEDAENLLDYVNRVSGETDYLAFGRGELNWPLEKEQKFIKDYLDSENKLLVIAEIEGNIAGAIGFAGNERKRMRHTGEFGVTVLRKYWGMGLGSALIKCMIEWAKDVGGVRKINLRVRVDNQRALNLYERFGFVKEGLVSRQFSVAGEFHDAYFMGLPVDP